VLVNSCVIIASWVPLVLAITASGGIIVLQRITRHYRVNTQVAAPVFPSSRDLPWLCGLIGGATAWFYAISVEPNFLREVREADTSVHHAASSFFRITPYDRDVRAALPFVRA